MGEKSLHQIFFVLLRAGLWNIPVSAPNEYFPLSEEEWKEIFAMARKQTLEAIIYDGIMNLPDEQFPKNKLLYKWVATVDSIEQRNDRMDTCLRELNDFFSKHNIKAFLLKGQGVASCYNIPHHRVCGDIDLFFLDKKDYERSNTLLTSKGIKIKKTPGFSSEYSWRNIHVEHHKKLFDIHNPFTIRNLNNLHEHKLRHSSALTTNNNILIPSPLISTLVVNIHILKHSLSFGIGLRQLCDAARIYYTYSQKLQQEDLYKIYRSIGIEKWIQILHQILVDNIGLEERYLPFSLNRSSNPDWMLNEILESGNFGFEDNRFGGNTSNLQRKRSNVFQHLLHRFCLNIRYAPGEALFFPIVQLASRITNRF